MHFKPWRAFAIIAFSAIVCVLAIPNLISPDTFKSLPRILQHKMVLGLDLQGGSHLLLQVDADVLRKERVENLRDETRRILRETKIGYTNLSIQGLTVSVRIREEKDLPEALRKLRELAQPIGGVFAGSGITDLDVVDAGGGLIRLTVTNAGITQRIGSGVERAIEIIRNRLDATGTVEPSIQRQGLDRILVQVPGWDDPEALKRILGETAKLYFRMVDQTVTPQQAQQQPPADSEVLFSNDNPPQPYVIEKRIIVSGDDLVDAQPGTDQRTGEWTINFRFNSSGARRFGQATRDNVGRPFAIVLDNGPGKVRVISAPVIREPILGGSGQISGSFTAQSATELAILLRSGALPAPLSVIEERNVGPGLGADSIQAGLTAAIIGSVAVVIFMLATYGLFGVFANIAVAVNVGMILGILSLLGATLTLPGIAGIVLTVGIAVDSNVLIYERIREEVRAGRSAISALNAGFDRALATILDSNLTTFIAAVVLFYVGTGPVRGFAVTFGIGILTTLFTAFTFTRLLTALWYHWWRPKTLPI
jgi:protein-export membrane protein SecD